jgi:pimeloyl-ACP methyl ester carboxylesterase
MASDPKPTIALIPGAWHTPYPIYELVSKLLQEASYPTHPITLPTLGSPSSFADYLTAIRAAITSVVEEGQDVVVVMHSYGGVAGTAALKGLGKEERKRAGLRGGVARLVYVAAMVPKEGETAGDTNERNKVSDEGSGVLTSREGTMVPGEIEGTIVVTDAVERFYNDITRGRAEELAKELKPHSWNAFRGQVEYAAYKDIPSAYLVAMMDKAIGWKSQEKAAREVAGCDLIERVEAGHSPFLSRPEEVARFIRRAAGEVIDM